MKGREIFRFEISYQLRQPTFWLLFSGLLAFAGVANVAALSSGETQPNAPAMIAFVSVFGNLVWLLTAGVIAGNAAARDRQTRMQALVFTSPLSRLGYLGGRFLAAFSLNGLLVMAIPLGLLLTYYIPIFGLTKDELGPFRLAAYLNAYGIVALPSVFAATALQFTLAVLSGRSVAAYLASLIIFIVSQFISTTLGHGFHSWETAKILDLIGFTSVARSLEAWSVEEQNRRLLSLSGALLANRILWTGFALLSLAMAWLRFRFRHHSTGSSFSFFRKARKEGNQPAPTPEVSLQTGMHGTTTAFKPADRWRQVRSIALASFRSVAGSKLWWGLLAVFMLIVVLFAPEFMEFNGVPIIPRTSRMIAFLTSSLQDIRTPLVIIPLLIIFYSGELVWREREDGIHPITDAAPLTEWVLTLGKLLGLALAIALWMLVLMLTGILTQAGLQFHDFQLHLYLAGLFGLQFPTYLLFAVLAISLHALVNHKYLAYLVLVSILGIMAFAPQLGIGHKLLLYGSDTGWSYSDISGFEPHVWPWLWFKVYSLAWAVLLVVAARLAWVRSAETQFKKRWTLAKQRWGRSSTKVFISGLLVLLLSGGVIFYNTNVLNDYATATDQQEWRAAYEKKYGPFAAVPKPALNSIKLNVELYPHQKRADIAGEYHLVNRAQVPIREIHLNLASEVVTDSLSFDRAAERRVRDEKFRYRIYTLEKPLLPGDSLQLSFRLRFDSRGFSNRGANPAVLSNGTYFTNYDWLPQVGYGWYNELNDKGARKKYGLTTRPFRPSVYDEEARYFVREEQLSIETLIGTDDDQLAVAPGVFQGSWTAKGRKYFHYATRGPVKNGFAIYSADYSLHEETWGSPGQEVAIQIFHHPGHDRNLKRMTRSIKAALDYYTQNYGPYPYSYLRFVERPGSGYGLHAEAGIINYEEGFALLDPREQGLDLVFYVVAHEVAHQWSGAAQLIPAHAEGAIVLSESFACYSGLKVLEKEYGRGQVDKLLALWREAYEVPRVQDSIPLIRATGPFQGYRTGPIALLELSRNIGDTRLNAAFRALIQRHAKQGPPLPTTLELYDDLQAVTPDSLQHLLYRLFKTSTGEEA